MWYEFNWSKHSKQNVMFKELKFLGYFLIIFLSFFFVIKYYLSEDNIKRSNRIVYQHKNQLEKKFQNLPLVESDTENIIEYKTDVDDFINKEKKSWWKLIK